MHSAAMTRWRVCVVIFTCRSAFYGMAQGCGAVRTRCAAIRSEVWM